MENNFYSYGSTSKTLGEAVASYGNAINDHQYLNIDGRGNSMRHGMTYEEYSAARPEDRIPKTHRDIIFAMEDVYDRCGIVKNIIDLMTDFVVQGISISHPNPTIQRFYQNWFSRINAAHVSERIACNLFKYGTSIVTRRYARLTKKLRRDIQTSKADLCNPSREMIGKIQCRYNFVNPSLVDVAGDKLSAFVSGHTYGLRIPEVIKSALRMPDNEEDRATLKDIPANILQAVKSDKNFIPFNMEDTVILHYKKDDWSPWAKPISYSILKDIYLLDKLKLADFVALDGAVDYVRIFKLGNLEAKLYPGSASFSKLAEALQANNGTGIRNILWGPDIDVIESKTDIYQFLGDDKYQPALDGIYAGLGIPPTLTGTGSQTGGSTNNLVSLKALIKRLDYVRQQVISFWNTELAMIQKTLGHQKPAVIEFDIANFGDEEAEKKLWIDLADRNIVSHEWLQKRFGASSDVEESRLLKEEKARSKEKKVAKVGPFQQPTQDSKTNLGGRPANVIETKRRKKRAFKPVIRASELKIWANEAHEKINEFLNPIILEIYNKKNMRSLSSEETEAAHKMKICSFLSLDPMQALDPRSVLASSKKKTGDKLWGIYSKNVNDIQVKLNRSLTVQECKEIASEILGVYKYYE